MDLDMVCLTPFGDFISRLTEFKRLDNMIYATGPVFLSQSLLELDPYKVHWVDLPIEVMFWQAWYENIECTSVKECQTRYPKAFAILLWSHSWGVQGKHQREWNDAI